MNTPRSVRLIALIEASKGALVLLAGCGLLELIHRDAQRLAEEFVRLFHLNPASRVPRIFVSTLAQASDTTLWLLAGAAFLYAALRLLEAFGLWSQQRWAVWLGTLSGAIYIPIEIYELVLGVTGPKVIILVLNALCLVVLVQALRAQRMSAVARL